MQNCTNIIKCYTMILNVHLTFRIVHKLISYWVLSINKMKFKAILSHLRYSSLQIWDACEASSSGVKQCFCGERVKCPKNWRNKVKRLDMRHGDLGHLSSCLGSALVLGFKGLFNTWCIKINHWKECQKGSDVQIWMFKRKGKKWKTNCNSNNNKTYNLSWKQTT